MFIVERNPVSDHRGDSVRLFCEKEFGIGLGESVLPIRQANLSRNVQPGTVRGLHILLPPAKEFKVVTCVTGAVWDVAVDLRPESPTVGMWVGCELRSDENRSMLIPPGVAHGYQVLEENSSVLYLHSERYRKDLDAGVRTDDPRLAIAWPLPVRCRSD